MEDFLFNLDQNDKSLVTDIIKTKVNKLFNKIKIVRRFI